MHWKAMIICISIGATMSSALAQVHRCQDGSGKIVFSDRPCGPGQSGHLVQQKRTREEILEDRLRAAEANEQKYRKLAEERESRANMYVPAIPRHAPEDKSTSYECKQAQRDHETVSTIQTGTAEQRRGRFNASTAKMNAACGMNTEMIQPPTNIVIPPPNIVVPAPNVWIMNR